MNKIIKLDENERETSVLTTFMLLHLFITAPSKKVAKIDSPSSPNSPGKRKRLPQANVLNNQSPSKFYPNPQAKSILGSSPSKPQANPKQISRSNPQTITQVNFPIKSPNWEIGNMTSSLSEIRH